MEEQRARIRMKKNDTSIFDIQWGKDSLMTFFELFGTIIIVKRFESRCLRFLFLFIGYHLKNYFLIIKN